MTQDLLSRGSWRLQQAILWSVCLFGGGGLVWWISTRDLPVWAKVVLLVTVGSTVTMGAPATYRAYLQDQREQADYADLLQAGNSDVLAKCHSCGRHTYVGSATCVRCGAADPIPDAAGKL